MGRRSDLTAESTRAALVDGALRVLLRKGYEGTRVAEIASEAGVTPAAIYNHFSSKEELLVAAITAQAPDLVGELLAAEGEDLAVVDVFRQIGSMLVAHVPTLAPLLSELVALSARDEAVRTVVRREIGGREATVRDLVRLAQRADQIDPRLDAAALSRLVTLLGLGANAAATIDLEPVDDAAWLTIIARMLDAISLEGSTRVG